MLCQKVEYQMCTLSDVATRWLIHLCVEGGNGEMGHIRASGIGACTYGPVTFLLHNVYSLYFNLIARVVTPSIQMNDPYSYINYPGDLFEPGRP